MQWFIIAEQGRKLPAFLIPRDKESKPPIFSLMPKKGGRQN